MNYFFNPVLLSNASILTFSLYCFSIQIGRSKLLLIRCRLLLPLWGSVFVPCFVVQCYVAIVLMGKRELVVLLCLSSWCLVALPHGVVGWSAVCDCGIF